jgi:hypothetical protein
VQVRCTGAATIALVSATPSEGFRVQVGDRGPEEVEVHFASSSRGAEIHLTCRQGQPELSD